MARTIVGIDIGSCRLKLAICSGRAVRRVILEDMPESLIRDGRIVSPEAMAAFIKKTASKARINVRRCAVILPAAAVFTRVVNLPVMTREHLELNLPYEFRDFITQEKDKYFYDYAMLDTLYDEQGGAQEFELIAAATLKETIAGYCAMFRRAGFKLVIAIPEELGYMNVIRGFEQSNGEAKEHEYCFIDLGHSATRLHIYKGVKHQASRAIDFGTRMLDTAIAEMLGTDEYIARAHKHANTNNVLYGDECARVYSMISIEAMRAINFYRFNSPDSNLTEVILCGGGAEIEPLAQRLAADIGMPVRMVCQMLPETGKDCDVTPCPAAIGAAMQYRKR